ncbi:MAG: hypothetical protein V4655_04885 [Bdellovibrionota bacterium]
MTFPKKLLVIGLCSYSSALFGQAQAVLSHPFQSHSSLNLSSSHNLGDQPLRELAPGALEDLGLNSRFHLRSKEETGLNLYNDNKIESISYGFELDSVPVCDLEVKVHRSLDGQTTLMGDLPPNPAGQASKFVWADSASVEKIVSQTFVMASLGADSKVLSQEACLYTENGLKPVYKMVVEARGLIYEVVADGNEVYRFDPRHFHANGTAEVYEFNSTDGQTASLELPDMDPSGYLVNKNFQSCLPTTGGRALCKPGDGTANYPFAQKANLDFDYSPQTEISQFTQTSVFAHTNQALKWLKNHGYQNYGTALIKLLPHAVFSNGDINNALYQPATTTTTPMILVGDGDGVGLQNLGTDGDVVSHELGHHVVYHTVKTISGESLVLHEALADFFTFARTGDACLGESICPQDDGRSYCYKPRQCLRTAENDLKFGAAGLPTQAHLQGQFVSGMLWDMNTKDSIPMDHLVTLVLKGIDLLVTNSGYKHFIVALMLVDHSDFDGQYCSKILSRAKSRGLESKLTDVTCDTIVDNPTLTPAPTSSVATPTAAKSSSKKSCGTLSGSSSGQSASLLLILFLPIAISFFRRKSN